MVEYVFPPPEPKSEDEVAPMMVEEPSSHHQQSLSQIIRAVLRGLKLDETTLVIVLVEAEKKKTIIEVADEVTQD